MAKRLYREDKFELTASIERVEQSYYISQHRDIERPVSDEAMLEMTGQITVIDPAYRQHRDRSIEMTLLCARSFAKDEATPTGNKSVLFSLNLRKGACSLLAYLPSDAFWALPGMISSKAVTHIGVRFSKPYRGSADLVALHFTTCGQRAFASFG
ncbi:MULTISPECIES: hypothetical protein [Sphingomonas]|jgi:hypothetical protein|uniref:Uncharacterized protein n=1 Tax=Sphingomonas zeae TaxID=1646122 RepID=A0A7Y6EFH7_9SPHN|nr:MULTISPECIES: hypothetical protein [Sphingomonas]MBB4050359.1 hypothetical protein [Sphingomonas zeae]NUU45396.1 hypothetical protein [Sphingomonas zeae]